MKIIPLLLAFISFSLIGVDASAQRTELLTVVFEKEDGKIDQVLHYPPGATYKVMEANGTTLQLDQPEKSIYEFKGNYTLIVRPPYSNETDNFKLGKRLARLYTNNSVAVAAGFGYYSSHKKEKAKQQKPNEKYGRYDQMVKAQYEVSPSNTLADRYNLELRFENGIEFSYKDGIAKASLEGEELEIANKYIIKTKLGTAKVSFSPSSGKVYYIFSPDEN